MKRFAKTRWTTPILAARPAAGRLAAEGKTFN
jgi:hypothetical protein